VLAAASRSYRTLHPGPGLAELDSREVLDLIFEVIEEVAAGTTADPVRAMCMSAMGEAAVPVSCDRKILRNSILFTDTRGREYVADLERKVGREAFYRINPNILGTSYTMPKILWMRDHEPQVYQETELFLLWPDFVAFMLGCEPATNHTHANRTLLFDIHREDWSDELLAATGIPREKLPPTKPPGTVLGTVSEDVGRRLGLPRGVVVVAGAHDQCCASLGVGITSAGHAVCGIGTVESITPTYGGIPELGLMQEAGLNVEHHILPGLYVSFIYNQAGSLISWFRDTFAGAEPDVRDGVSIYDRLSQEMPAEPTSLVVLPYFEVTGAPTFVEDASGVIVGLHTSTSRGEIFKAIMEGETYYFVESMQFLGDRGIDTSEIVATGGGAKSDAWLQIKADVLGVPFVRSENTEAGTAGAAMMAGLATGVFGSPEQATDAFVRFGRRFEPNTPRHRVYREQYERYRRLYPSVREIL
jgi:xylulokinase